MNITRQRNIETVKKFLALLEQEKINDFVDLFAPDGRQINPYASGIFPDSFVGHKALHENWDAVPAQFDGMQFPIEEIFPMEDPAMVLVKYKGKIKLKNDAGYYNNDYLLIFKFNEAGKILEYHEYFNPVTVIRAFVLKDKI